MYEYFQGRLANLEPTQAVVDCGGVGYLLEITLNTYEALRNASSDNVKLYAHHVVREDAHQLFGFYEMAEREMFRILVGVNGVGNQTARMMLSSLTVDELRAAIQMQDIKKVQRVKGIGAKTAQRIIIDLKDKVSVRDMLNVYSTGNSSQADTMLDTARSEAIEALTALGYSSSEALRAVKESGAPNDADVETIIKLAFNRITRL